MFTYPEKALMWLQKRGYTHLKHGSWYHHDELHRDTMGAISYRIDKVDEYPVDPE